MHDVVHQAAGPRLCVLNPLIMNAGSAKPGIWAVTLNRQAPWSTYCCRVTGRATPGGASPLHSCWMPASSASRASSCAPFLPSAHKGLASRGGSSPASRARRSPSSGVQPGHDKARASRLCDTKVWPSCLP